MENATFRKWLIEQGCRFDSQHEERGEGHGTVTIHREGRTAELPLAGSRQDSRTEGPHLRCPSATPLSKAFRLAKALSFASGFQRLTRHSPGTIGTCFPGAPDTIRTRLSPPPRRAVSEVRHLLLLQNYASPAVTISFAN
jgi:hypothetical protein